MSLLDVRRAVGALRHRRRSRSCGRQPLVHARRAPRCSASSASPAVGRASAVMSLLRLLPSTANVTGSAEFDGVDLLTASLAAVRRDPRPRDRVRLPGADDLAEPGVPRRQPDRRGARAASRPRAGGRSATHDRAARPRAHPRARAPGRRVPAPALGRDAPARDDRDGPGVRSEDPDRRRADDCARRDDPGRDPRPAARHSRAARHRDRPDHAQPRRGRRHRRPTCS